MSSLKIPAATLSMINCINKIGLMTRSRSRHSNLCTLAVIANLEMPLSTSSHLSSPLESCLCDHVFKDSSQHLIFTPLNRVINIASRIFQQKAKLYDVSLPFRAAVGVALRYGWLWLCGRMIGGDAAAVGTQQQAEKQTQHQRQQEVVVPV